MPLSNLNLSSTTGVLKRNEPTLSVDSSGFLASIALAAQATPEHQLSTIVLDEKPILGRIEPSLSTSVITADEPIVLTAATVCDYLSQYPDFFKFYPEVLEHVQLPDGLVSNRIQRQKKQIDLLKQSLLDNNQQLEQLLKHAKANEEIAQKLHQITLCLLAQRSVALIANAAQEAVAHVFGLQDTAIRVWGAEDIYQDLVCNQAVSEDIKTFADGLKHPYCGVYAQFSVVDWLPRPVESLGIIALRVTPNAKAFGLFVIGSQDKHHFSVHKSTDFLVQLGQILSASLGRMLPPYS
jgi:uncharacterized protein